LGQATPAAALRHGLLPNVPGTHAGSLSDHTTEPELEAKVSEFEFHRTRGNRPLWVKLDVLTVNPTLPVHPEQRTSADQPGWSEKCQQQTLKGSIATSHTDAKPYRVSSFSLSGWLLDQ